jgi:hypothetical protein
MSEKQEQMSDDSAKYVRVKANFQTKVVRNIAHGRTSPVEAELSSQESAL